MASILTLILCVLALQPAWADAGPSRLQRLLSADFAAQSADALARGDRDTALIAALRGLPHMPTPEEVAQFPAAAEMLFRVTSGRVTRIDRTMPQEYSVNIFGDRAVLRPQAGFGVDGRSELDPVILVDPTTGATIAELLPGEETNAAGIQTPGAVRFSPDGRTIAITSNRTGLVHIFDGVTGAAWGTLPGGQLTPLGTLISGGPIGFSLDGLSYGIYDHTGLTIWDSTNTPTTWPTQQAGTLAGALGWAFDGSVVIARQPIRGGTQTLERCVASGCATLMEVPRDLGSVHYIYLSPYSAHVIAMTDFGLTLLDLQSGARIVDSGADAWEFAFVRGGSALAFHWPGRNKGRVRVFDLTGQELEPTLQDAVLFDHRLYNLAGDFLGVVPDVRHVYAAEDVPTGAALYAQVWAALPTDVQADIQTDRVTRD